MSNLIPLDRQELVSAPLAPLDLAIAAWLDAKRGARAQPILARFTSRPSPTFAPLSSPLGSTLTRIRAPLP